MSSIPFAGESNKLKPTVAPDQEIKNQTTEPIFLILELQPGQKFVNKTNQTFRVMEKKEFFRYNYRFELESKIKQHSESAMDEEENIEQLDNQLNSVKSQYDNTKHNK